MTDKQVYWLTSALRGAGITAVLGVLGWMALSVVTLQSQMAADRAEDALRDDLQDAFNDIDKRLAVMENNQQWMGRRQQPEPVPVPMPAPAMMPYDIVEPFEDIGEDLAPEPVPPAPEPEDELPTFKPRYDFRQHPPESQLDR
jgi:hypothetical protein